MNRNKKVATMTWIHNNNYGSILQAYALQKVLLNNEYDTEIIDYNPSKIVKTINLFKSHNSIKLFYSKLRGLVSKIYSKKNGHDIVGKEKKIDEFIDSELKKTKVYNNPKKLEELSGKYDVYICGSDQIWNPDLLNPPYFFSFLKENDKKISYSPSFGVNEIKSNKKKVVKKYLDNFSSISVREEQGINILNSINIKNKNIMVTVDPTLLLEQKYWNDLCEKDINKEKGYVLCYFLNENENYWKSARNISEKLKADIVIIPNSKDSYTQDFRIIDNVGPIEWINLIKNAKFVLTDSFHGVLFSLIFQVDFYAYKRFEDNSPKSQNSRLYNILKKVDLENRLYGKNDIINDVNKISSYKKIEEVLSDERDKSLRYLIDSIEN